MDALAYSVATKQQSTGYQQLLPGNTIPHEWYKRFTGGEGPDLALMSVLSEIVYWYRPKKVIEDESVIYTNKFLGDSWQTSYKHFEKKFGFKREKLRRIFVKLENLGLIKREFKTVAVRGQDYNNRLFIHLDPAFLKDCFPLKGTTKADLPSSTISDVSIAHNIGPEVDNSPNDTIAVSSISPNGRKGSFFEGKKEGGSPRFGGDIYRYKNKNNIKENRSTAEAESNFLNNSFKNLSMGNLVVEEQAFNAKEPYQKRLVTKSLKDFYPLSDEDCNKLQSLSGREFSSRAMNEILLDMSEKLKDRWFKGKKNFLSYMSKVFMYEKRQAVRVNNETFRIKNNLKTADEELQKQIALDVEKRRQEQYLTEVEYSLEVSPEWHLKKKLAAVLERSKSYNLLTSYVRSWQEGDKFLISLNSHQDLSQMDRNLILSQVKATQEQGSFASGKFSFIKELELVMPEKRPEPELELAAGFDVESGEGSKETNSKNPTKQIAKPQKGRAKGSAPADLWERVRASLVAYYGPKGEILDKQWFSKLLPEVDEAHRRVKLKAPSNFIRDWIRREYSQVLGWFFQDELYQWEIC